jgi:hypothetical protein
MAVQTHVPDRVRELRAAGYSPKQIAKTLDLRPAVAARLVRMLAAEQAAAAPEPAVVGCWVSPGWSAHLTVEGPEQWADVPPPEDGMTGWRPSLSPAGTDRSECRSAATSSTPSASA